MLTPYAEYATVPVATFNRVPKAVGLTRLRLLSDLRSSMTYSQKAIFAEYRDSVYGVNCLCTSYYPLARSAVSSI